MYCFFNITVANKNNCAGALAALIGSTGMGLHGLQVCSEFDQIHFFKGRRTGTIGKSTSVRFA
jgi:hypothetical protein